MKKPKNPVPRGPRVNVRGPFLKKITASVTKTGKIGGNTSLHLNKNMSKGSRGK